MDQSPTTFKELNLLAEAVVTYHGNIVDVNVDKYIENYKHTTFDILACFDDKNREPVTIPASLPIIPIIASARSGNRFIRTCLKDIAEENILAFNRAHGTSLGKHGPTIRLQVHDDDTISQHKEGAILLIRNPRDVIISDFFHHHCVLSNQEVVIVTEWIRNKTATWTDWIDKSIDQWKTIYLDWLEKSERILIVYSEDVAKSPIREFARMLVFLNQTVSLEQIQCGYAQNQWDPYRYLDFEPHLPQELLQPAIDILNKALTDKGASPLPTYANTYL
ncbi:putative WSC domain-containing protein 1-like [Apostichopus japonicus]|uniref:Putative WSC domain-containing protein 1-like n=2 Tax=Stichopus japonicus TaxID=307972 RepID=A0A2G8KM29_STIJA|nr:putative WSC domain-containing protein 1-like [Apostichopus japonicus]